MNTTLHAGGLSSVQIWLQSLYSWGHTSAQLMSLWVTWAGQLDSGNSELWSVSLLSCITAFAFASFPLSHLEVQVAFFLRCQNYCQPSLAPLLADYTLLLEFSSWASRVQFWGQKPWFHFVTIKFILLHNIPPPPIISWGYRERESKMSEQTC